MNEKRKLAEMFYNDEINVAEFTERALVIIDKESAYNAW